jgi:hypothetical protein
MYTIYGLSEPHGSLVGTSHATTAFGRLLSELFYISGLFGAWFGENVPGYGFSRLEGSGWSGCLAAYHSKPTVDRSGQTSGLDTTNGKATMSLYPQDFSTQKVDIIAQPRDTKRRRNLPLLDRPQGKKAPSHKHTMCQSASCLSPLHNRFSYESPHWFDYGMPKRENGKLTRDPLATKCPPQWLPSAAGGAIFDSPEGSASANCEEGIT